MAAGVDNVRARTARPGKVQGMQLDARRPFTWKQGRAAGISERQLRSPAYRKILTGVYVAAGVEVDPYVEGQAALVVAGPQAFLSHHTAARLYRAVVPDVPTLHAAVAPGVRRSEHRGVAVHRSRRPPARFRGLPVTTPVDTFLDLATHLTLVDLVVLGDSLVRRGRTTPPALVEAADRAGGRGVRLARRAASLVRSGVDSPMETRARLLRVLSGLPELETDIRFHDEHGALRRRLDAGDRGTRTAVEYDGRHHVQREEQWEADLGRREELENDDWRVVTLTGRDIYVTPERTVRRLRTIFRARGMRLGRSSDEWRLHFRGQGWAA